MVCEAIRCFVRLPQSQHRAPTGWAVRQGWSGGGGGGILPQWFLKPAPGPDSPPRPGTPELARALLLLGRGGSQAFARRAG